MQTETTVTFSSRSESVFMAWSRRTTLISSLIIIAAGLVLIILGNVERIARSLAPRPKEHTLATIPFNGERAYEHLKTICDLGPRVSGTLGMEQQQELVTKHFESFGATVTRQEFEARNPETGKATALANLIVEFHPERKKRVLLCAHYDTRPFPDEDPDPTKRRDVFVGANDGASGVALLMELATHIGDYKGPHGIDFILFDAEELVYDRQRDKYFLGSEYFAQQYVQKPPAHKYICGVLLDMVADKHLQVYQERTSAFTREVRPITNGIWNTAQRLGVRDFIPQPRYDIKDDHLALINTAHIPTCDVIDFDYPKPGASESYWHTTQDIPENCSALSLAKVGWVVHTWLTTLK